MIDVLVVVAGALDVLHQVDALRLQGSADALQHQARVATFSSYYVAMKPVGRPATRLCIVTALAVTGWLPLSSELLSELKAQSQGAQQAPQSQEPPPQPLPDSRDLRFLMAIDLAPVQQDSPWPCKCHSNCLRARCQRFRQHQAPGHWNLSPAAA